MCLNRLALFCLLVPESLLIFSLPGDSLSSMAEPTSEVWTLRDREDTVATITITDSDFPWLSGRLDAKSGFEKYRNLFDAELAAMEREDWEEADRRYYAIREQLQLMYPEGGRVPEFLLHVRGDEAWFRWSDEPFEEQIDAAQSGRTIPSGQAAKTIETTRSAVTQ
jgi:hypothetical protein